MFGFKKRGPKYEFSLNLIAAKIALMWVTFAILVVMAFTWR